MTCQISELVLAHRQGKLWLKNPLTQTTANPTHVTPTKQRNPAQTEPANQPLLDGAWTVMTILGEPLVLSILQLCTLSPGTHPRVTPRCQCNNLLTLQTKMHVMIPRFNTAPLEKYKS